MKFSIERAALLKAVAQAQSVVERRNTIPILSNVLIRAGANGDGGRLAITGTDLDAEIVVSRKCAFQFCANQCPRMRWQLRPLVHQPIGADASDVGHAPKAVAESGDDHQVFPAPGALLG